MTAAAPGYGMDDTGRLYELTGDSARPLTPNAAHPLASKDGITALMIMIEHGQRWRALTRPQQQTLASGTGHLTCWRHLQRKGLATSTDDGWELTELGRWLVAGAARWGRPVADPAPPSIVDAAVTGERL